MALASIGITLHHHGFRFQTPAVYPHQPEPTSAPLRFGILGAARVAPLSLILPVKNHADAVVHAVAARDQNRADTFAKKHGIAKAYGGTAAYQELLDDPEIDAVYIPLPNGLHYEWTMKALAAGKHVLLELPSTNTAEETRRMFDYAEKKGLVLLEAVHSRFHPAIRRTKEIVDSGELGTITKIETEMAIPSGIFNDSDIRFSYALGGGAFMEMGCYTLFTARYLAGADPLRVVTASADTSSAFPRIDIGTTATLAFPPLSSASAPSASSPGAAPTEITAIMTTHFRLPPRLGFIPQFPQVSARVIGTRGEVKLFNYLGPWLYHYITVKTTDENGVTKTRTEKAYGNYGWTTYRYQLEAFVDKIRGRTPDHWYDAQDSVSNLRWIERIYEATGLGSRPESSAQIPTD
ncbi:NAD(P)-binding protein [Auriscalpium vulgare]|uniref:NAD(P)-binding protein n=1 Tax=Auriscalpium vulgare TaxID=40419 RepID=A0ACB8RI06_9AGAM|nr:NAD(P)-binding protein [Auriscalpium vulgare]